MATIKQFKQEIKNLTKAQKVAKKKLIINQKYIVTEVHYMQCM